MRKVIYISTSLDDSRNEHKLVRIDGHVKNREYTGVFLRVGKRFITFTWEEVLKGETCKPSSPAACDTFSTEVSIDYCRRLIEEPVDGGICDERTR